MSKLSLVRTGDGSYTLSRGSNHETYHSTYGALAESTEVFLRNSGVQRRLQAQQPTSVLEIGFGAGLNFIVTAQCARQHRSNLHYVGCDLAPPPHALIADLLHSNTTECETEIANLLLCLGNTAKRPTAINNYTQLQLLIEDACVTQLPMQTFHAVYLDAFSHRESPLLWQAPLLKKLRSALRPDGVLATYSVNRPFKDALSEAGFTWQKLPGPAGKREVIIATA